MSSREQKTPDNDRGSSIEIVGFSVVLVENSNDPSILNPDFLRYNEIVDASLTGSGQSYYNSGLFASDVRWRFGRESRTD